MLEETSEAYSSFGQCAGTTGQAVSGNRTVTWTLSRVAGDHELQSSALICYCAYQSEYGAQRLPKRHWVPVRWWRHAERTPRVSALPDVSAGAKPKVFRGDQPQTDIECGGRMDRGSRSETTDWICEAHMPRHYDADRTPCSSASHSSRRMLARYFFVNTQSGPVV
jgi:hypothetical protein